MLSLLAITMGFGLASASDARALTDDPINTYQYTVRIPATAETCQTEASNLAARFMASTGVWPASGSCVDVVKIKAGEKFYTVYSLGVSYQAAHQIAPYSAYYGLAERFGLPDDEQGIFKTFSGCLAGRDAARLAFESQTGLSAVAVSCLPGASSYMSNYVLQIDAFGTPAKKLRLVELKFLGTLGDSEDSQIEDMIRALGGVVVARDGAQRLVYGDDNFAVTHDLLGTLKTKDECQSEVGLTQALYSKLGSSQALVFCMQSVIKTYYLEAVREGRFFLSGDMGSGHSRFYSFSECSNALARIDFGGTNYVGGLCFASDFAEGQYELYQYGQ